MRVLLTNDDGYHAKGIQALSAAFLARGDTVWMVAPKVNKSGTSCCLTLDRPLAVKRFNDTHFSLDGTPADSMHIALTGLASVDTFDVVVSGINDGANLGDDAIHSGTLGAAIQAHLYGLPALAVSLTERGWAHLDSAVRTTLTTVDRLLARPTPELWNLNVPNAANAHTLPTVQWARLGRRTPSYPVQALLSPKGGQYFWLGNGGDEIPDAGTDMAVIAAGNASLTPITLDRTDLAALAAYQSAV